MQLAALGMTIFIESCIIFTLNQKRLFRPSDVLILGVVPSLITHPLLWPSTIFLQHYISYVPAVILLEALVIVAEAFIIVYLTRVSIKCALTTSCIANVGSTIVGIGVWRWLY